MTSIYALADPRAPWRFRYIGKSRVPIARRLQAHTAECASDPHASFPRYRWLRELAREGVRPVIVLLEAVPREEEDAAESAWLDWARLFGPVLNGPLRAPRPV
jgi:hypothetical protein